MTAETKTDGHQHKCWIICLILLVPLFFCGVIFFNYISMDILGKELGIYLSDTGNLSDKYYTELTPAGWTFSIWGFIYIWQLLWIIYSLTLICRKTADGYLYITPPVIPPLTYLFYIMNLICNAGWLITFDREQLIVSCVVLFGAAIALYIPIFLCVKDVHKCAKALLHHGKKCELWCLRIFVHNGLAFYAGWCTLASLLNLAMVLAYQAKFDVQIASTVSLVVLCCELGVLFIIENFVFEKEMRYIFAHYFSVIVGLVGSFYKNYWNVHTRNAYIIAALLGCALFFLVIKVIRSVYMHCKRPLYKPDLDTKELYEAHAKSEAS